MLKEILEEIKIKKKNCLDIVKIEIDPMEITIHREQYKGLRMAEDIIRKNMNDGWIPVEERLPDDGTNVLVWYEYFRYGSYNCMYQTYGIGYRYNEHWRGDVSGEKARCIAWRPLPEPYHPEKGREEST